MYNLLLSEVLFTLKIKTDNTKRLFCNLLIFSSKLSYNYYSYITVIIKILAVENTMTYEFHFTFRKITFKVNNFLLGLKAFIILI